MERVRGFLLHTGVICSLVCITAKVLDWYNPYMDFSGHILFLQFTLYFIVILPKDAAKAFDSMVPDEEELIVRILENLTPDAQAAILSKMSVTNAAIITEKMQQ